MPNDVYTSGAAIKKLMSQCAHHHLDRRRGEHEFYGSDDRQGVDSPVGEGAEISRDQDTDRYDD